MKYNKRFYVSTFYNTIVLNIPKAILLILSKIAILNLSEIKKIHHQNNLGFAKLAQMMHA